ncbi:MAG: glycosyltransferase [Planctomycetota bacterium]|nr:glycosyltransferase [Planctomycetota bacterium]
MPIRVLHIIGQIGVGGCEMQLLELCRRMDHSKFQLGLCYYAPNPDNMVREFQNTGVKLYFVNKFGGISLWRFFLTLRQFILDFNPDIIHTWQYSPNWWGRLAGLSCGYRHFIASDRGTFGYQLASRLAEFALNRRTLRTANSEAVARYVHGVLKVPLSRIVVIPNGVEVPPLDRQEARDTVRREFGLLPDQLLVLAVGRQTWAKNYPMLFRAARKTVARRSDTVFLCAGHGELEETLQQLHREMGLGASLRMLGLRHDVPRLMAAADVFCTSSRTEGCPNAVLEAMASGLPVVAARFEAACEIVADGRTGFLVGLNDDEAMADRLLDLLGDPALRARMGRAALDEVRDRFSFEKLVQRMSRLYTDFLDSRRAGLTR